MKNIKILYLFVLIGLLASCDRDELLDVKPYNKIIPETVEEYRQWMNNRGDRIKMYEIDRYMTDDVKVPEGTLDEYLGFGVNTRRQDALTWKKYFGDIEQDDEEWLRLYEHVFESLMVEEDMLEGVSGSEQEAQKIIAELKVHRAAAYFALVNLYSVQYDSLTAKSDLGVPIHANAQSVEAATPRASVQEVYNEVIRNLTEAIEMNALEESVPTLNYQASKVGAYAMLARVYLQMMKYEEARDAAQKALDIYSHLADWNEWLTTEYPRNTDNPEVILLKDYHVFYDPVQIYVADEVIAMFDTDDLRPDIRFTQGTNGKFMDEYNYTNSKQYIGPSVPEMYLIRAECNARINDGAEFQKAIDDLNTLRVNRYATGTYVDLTIAELPTDDATLAFVKAERRRELYDRGTRLFDLKRYNLSDPNKTTITRDIEGKITVLSPDSPNWTVPIAEKVISLAPEIEQNERENLN